MTLSSTSSLSSSSHEIRRAVVALLPELRRRAERLAGQGAAADDLLHDTIERALRFSDGYQPGTNAKAWLMTVLYSAFISGCRRVSREREAMRQLRDVATSGATVARSTLPTQRLSPAFERTLGELPPGFRQVLELVHVKDLTCKETAEALCVPLGTVMSRLHRSHASLRMRLGESALERRTPTVRPRPSSGPKERRPRPRVGSSDGPVRRASHSVG